MEISVDVSRPENVLRHVPDFGSVVWEICMLPSRSFNSGRVSSIEKGSLIEARKSRASSKQPHLRLNVFLFLVLAFGFLARAAVLASGWVMGQWSNSLCQGSLPCTTNSLFRDYTSINFLWTFASLIMGGLAASFVFRVILSWLAIKKVSLLHDQLFQGLARAPFLIQERSSSARILQTSANDYSALLRFVGGSLGELFSYLIDIILVILIFVFIGPSDILPLLLLMSGSYWIFKKNQKALAINREEIAKARAEILWAFKEEIDGKLEIDVYDAAAYFERRFDVKERSFHGCRRHNQKSLSRFNIQIAALNALAILFMGILAIVKVRFGYGTIGQVVQSMTYLFLFSISLQALFEMLARVEEARVAAKGLRDSTKEATQTDGEVQAASREPASGSLRSLPPAELAIHDLSVTFETNNTLQLVLSKLSLTLKERETIGIIGASGSGKSTLIHSLLGLYPLASGKIFWANQDLAQHPELREILFSVVPQTPILFAGTIRENLLGDDVVDHGRLTQLVIDLALPQMLGVRTVNEVLDFTLTYGASNISAGVRQMLGMARGLIQNRPVLIFDEPTSSMDAHGQANTMAALKRYAAGQAQLRIAHTPEAIADCDRIIWLERGLIKMMGNPDEIFPVYFKNCT